ncbi:MAG: hypothetical protein WBM24_23515 [Candidatus Sulfotelmatobacter sp.]
MNYSKPEVNTLGQAKSVIEQNNTIKTPHQVLDANPKSTEKASAAYDLDD